MVKSHLNKLQTETGVINKSTLDFSAVYTEPDPGGGVFWGTPKLHKEGKTACARENAAF